MAPAMFLSPSWVEAVRDALDAGPDDETRVGKLPEYWDFYQMVRAGYQSSWALGARRAHRAGRARERPQTRP